MAETADRWWVLAERRREKEGRAQRWSRPRDGVDLNVISLPSRALAAWAPKRLSTEESSDMGKEGPKGPGPQDGCGIR